MKVIKPYSKKMREDVEEAKTAASDASTRVTDVEAQMTALTSAFDTEEATDGN